MLNPETVPKPKMKDYFRTFIEDWNTVTLPKKYYDLAAHERKMKSIALGETLLLQEGQYDFRADEAAHARGSKQPTKKAADDQLSQEAVRAVLAVQSGNYWLTPVLPAHRVETHTERARGGCTDEEAGLGDEAVFRREWIVKAAVNLC